MVDRIKSPCREQALQALSMIIPTSGYKDQQNVADALYLLGDFENSLTLYQSLTENDNNSLMLRRLLVCMVNTDQRKKTLEKIKSLPKEVRELNFYRRILAHLYYLIGDFRNALIEVDAYLKKVTDDLQFIFLWLDLLKRSNETEKITEFFLTKPSFPDAPPELQMTFAFTLLDNNYLDRSLNLIYQLRRKFPENPTIHYGYIMFFLEKRAEISDMVPKTVQPNTSITIKNEHGAKHTYIIEGEFSGPGHTEEISPSHPVARATNGKVVSDKFTLDNNPIQEQEWEIIEIKNKYLFILHKTVNEYNIMFPEENNFWKIDFKKKENGELDLSPILKLADRRLPNINDINKMNKGPLPIALISKLLKKEPLNIWIDILKSGSSTLHCSTGNPDEFDHAINSVIESKNGCVVDPLTLYSIFYFDIQNEVKNTFGSIGITHSTLDFYQNQTKLTPNFPTDIYDWAKKNCDILPALGERDIPIKWTKLYEYMDSVFLDIIIAANGSNRILLSDDYSFRNLAKDIIGLKGTWLQMVLKAALGKNTITKHKYATTVAKMVDSHMDFITIDSDILMTLSDMNNLKVSDQFITVAKTLGNKNVSIETAVSVATEFISHIWHTIKLEEELVVSGDLEDFTFTIFQCLRTWRSENLLEIMKNAEHYVPLKRIRAYRTVFRKWRQFYIFYFPTNKKPIKF